MTPEEFVHDYNKWRADLLLRRKNGEYQANEQTAGIRWTHGLYGQIGEITRGKIRNLEQARKNVAHLVKIANWLETKFPYKPDVYYSVEDWMNDADQKGIMARMPELSASESIVSTLLGQ